VTALVQASGLTRRFNGQPAVDGLNLTVASGEIYALAGPDGAGKTTVLRLLCGALRADAGQVSLGGFDLARQTEQARAQIGYLPQRFGLYGELTVSENLRFLAEARGLPSEQWQERSREILAFVQLDEFADRRADALSGGMRQKLGLAAAIIHHPPILLLDEPTGGVDPVTRQQFWQLLIRLLGQGTAVLMSTPYMDEAARCTRVGFLDRGRLVAEGPPPALRAGLTGRLVDLRAGPRRLAERAARDHPLVERAQVLGDRLHLRLASPATPEGLDRLRKAVVEAGAELEWIRPVEPGLEDVFVQLLEQGAGAPTARAAALDG
jgi:ABC-2 type transport system ATP-binding protein